MNVAFVEPHLGVYGGIRRILELANGLAARGHTVTIYHSDGSPCTWMRCAASTAPIGDVAKARADVLVFNYPPDLPHVRRAGCRHVVFYLLGLYRKELLRRPDPRLFLLNRYWHERWLVRVLREGFPLWTNATWMHRWVRESLGRSSELLMGGVDHALFHPLGGGGRPSGIVTSGDPRPEKGYVLVEKAHALLPHDTHPLEKLHGKGGMQEELARRIRNAALFVDAQESRAVGWNNPIAEAMASGVPVVATPAEGNGDLLIPGVTGIEAPRRDAAALARAMAEILESVALREAIATRALAHVRQFTWERAVDRAEALLEAAVSGKIPPVEPVPVPPPSVVGAASGRASAVVLTSAAGAHAWAGRRVIAWTDDERRALAGDRTRLSSPWIFAASLHDEPEPAKLLSALAQAGPGLLVAPLRDYYAGSPESGRAFPFSHAEILALGSRARITFEEIPPGDPRWFVAHVRSA